MSTATERLKERYSKDKIPGAVIGAYRATRDLGVLAVLFVLTMNQAALAGDLWSEGQLGMSASAINGIEMFLMASLGAIAAIGFLAGLAVLAKLWGIFHE